MNFDLAHPLLVEASKQMDRWSRTRSRAALEWLLANGVLYSEPDTLNNATGWFGEFVIESATGFGRNRFAASLPDIKVPGRRHDLEVKTTKGRGGWKLGKFLFDGPRLSNGKQIDVRADYVLLRIDIPAGWRVVEAVLVPLAAAKRHADPSSGHYLPPNGPWRRERRVRELVPGR